MSKSSFQKKPQGHPISSRHGTDPSRPNLLTRPLMVLLLLALLAAAVYSNTFYASFHFDDSSSIVANQRIKDLTSFRDLSGSRDVGYLSFALNYQFGGLSVFGYHLVNLLIHIINGFLVYVLVRLLFRASDSSGAARTTTAPWIALAAALLFVAHPIQTQAVTYIVQRFASLAAMFYLLTVVCYLYWRLSPPDRKSRNLWYAGALIATILAMKTKETSFTLPFMLLLIEAVFFAPLIRKSWIRLIPFLLTLPIIPLSHPGALGEGEVGLARQTMDISRWDYLLTQFRVIVTYLRLLIFPVHQNLDYDYPVSHSLFDPPVFFSFLFLSALFVLALFLLFSSRLTSSVSRLTAFGILWFFLTLSIESSIIPIRDVIFEHRLYLPSVGFWLAAGTVLIGFSRRRPIVGIMVVGALVTVFSVATYQRNKVWQDELTLWSDVVQKSPQKGRGYNNLGLAYADRNRWSEAIQAYKTALVLRPKFAEAHNNLGYASHELGHREEAVREFQTASALKPDYAEPHNNLGNIYQELGRRDEAVREFQTALTLNPDFADAHNNLGNVYQELGRGDEAVREFQTAMALKPDYAEAHYNLGNVYQELGRHDEAVREYQTSLTLKPDYAEAHYNLGNVYQELGRRDEAVREFQTALTLKPDYAEAHIKLAAFYHKLGRIDEAIREYRAALAVHPDYSEIHNNLGNIYQRQGHLDKAIREYQTALTLNPDDTVAHYNLGVVYYAQGRIPQALREFQQSIQLKPDYPEAHNNLGYVYYESGRVKEAVREFQSAVRLKPDMAEAYFNLGQAYQRMGQAQNAAQAFQQALLLKPGYEKARQALKSLPR
jgi:protein O-mannosyl-transferase